MGCVSSKLFREEIETDIICNNVEYPNHVVSLTSTTYGLLNLEKETIQDQENVVSKEVYVIESKKASPNREVPEEINAWELMEGLEEEGNVVVGIKKSPRSRLFLRGFGDFDPKTPLKLLTQMGSPRKLKKSVGKENKLRMNLADSGLRRAEFSPNNVLRARNSIESPWRTSPKLRVLKKLSPSDVKCESSRVDSGVVCSRRRSLTPMFDPALTDEEQIKKMVTPRIVQRRNSKDSEAVLEMFEKICPFGCENDVVIYTTTLRGIRKTFEDCNIARSIIESHHVQMIERDISMHSGFKEELRSLMGAKNVKVPLVFVKGRLIGGADELVKLEEENKLELLFDGIPKAVSACEGCAGIRFIMCMDCNGSSKVLGSDGRRSIKCGECNENGLIQCPICC
ncbi:oxidoreductase [Lithospermum erythrorhizon]|uniref:Oxidoreductase n=1 Tax=Lithospermum erythrorhizon TaxID=34254 RepID=A0AAV3PJW6_LITER